HLHLQEVSGAFRINPQRPGALEFIDPDVPLFDTSISIGNAVGSLIPIAHDTASSPQVPPQLSDGSFLVSGPIDLLVSLRDGVKRKGVYAIRTTVTPDSDSSNILYDGRQNIQMDTVIDSTPGVRVGADLLFYFRNANSDTYYATNVKINNNSS